MRRYETITIIDPELSGEQSAPLVERVKELIPQQKGVLFLVDDWGSKKLAYEIKKKNRGHYVRFDYGGDGALVKELERFFKIDDRVLKYMTVLLDEDADAERIKAQVAAAQSPAAETEGPAAESKGAEDEAESPEGEAKKPRTEAKDDSVDETAVPEKIETPVAESSPAETTPIEDNKEAK